MRTLKNNDKVRLVHLKYLNTGIATLLLDHAKQGDIGIVLNDDNNYDEILVIFEKDPLVYGIHELCLERISNAEDFILNKE